MSNSKTKTPLSNKNKKILISVLSICLTVIVSLSIIIPVHLLKNKNKPFKIPALNLPIEEYYALNKFSYASLSSNTMTTLRADTMNVTQRDIERPTPSYLSDDYSLVYDTSTKTLTSVYGSLVSSTDTLKTATITFDDTYPSPKTAVSGANAFTNGTSNGLAVTDATFYKYMLMTQGQHLAVEAQNLSRLTVDSDEAKQNFANWLKKHPGADAQYGAVIGNAVQKEITLDPIYRANHATGLYLPAGEVVEVKVEGLKPGERYSIKIGLQNSLAWRGGAEDASFNAITGGINNVNIQSTDAYFTKADVLFANGLYNKVTLQSQWGRQNTRMPWLIADFTFDKNGTYYIGTPFGGVMHINPGTCYSAVKTTITGAVETPHYILGVTSPEYFDKYLRNAPGVVGVLDTENGQLVGPVGTAAEPGALRGVSVDEIDKLATLWHSFFAVNESFTGGTYNRANLVMFDQHVPAGAAVALGGYTYACPTSWFKGATNYRGLLTGGAWGILHEIGHNHGGSYGVTWGFNGGQEGEVRNNALIVLSYIMFCDIGSMRYENGNIPAEHGFVAHPYSSMLGSPFNTKVEDFNNLGYFTALSMYTNIMHSFGPEKFYELLYTYKHKRSYVEAGTTGNSRSDFAYRCSLVYGMNFLSYFNNFYGANIDAKSMFTEKQLAYMNGLPNYQTIACFYAGGIDGVKTGGDYLVNYGNDITFDLVSKTISTLDTQNGKGFKILSVDRPEHGTIKKVSDGVYNYSFNTKYRGAFDSFNFKVKLTDGVVHQFTVYLRINYNGATMSYYNIKSQGTLNENTWPIVEQQVSELSPTVSNINNVNISYKTASGWDVRVIDFYFKAPKTGKLTFHFKVDDGLKFYFGDSFNSLQEMYVVSTYIKDWTDLGNNEKVYSVEKGKYYAIRLVNVNTGGPGGVNIAYKYENEALHQITGSETYRKDIDPNKGFEEYVFEPNFIVSKKDGITVSNAGSDKGEWQVIKAPTDIQDGRIDTVVRTQIITELNENGEIIEKELEVEIELDKWTYLIDGDHNTNLHTRYNGSAPITRPSESTPHEFVIDTNRVQQFNYYTITTRSNPLHNSMVTAYELQISNDNVHYTTVVSGDKLAYKGNVATLSFPQVSGRYLRLLVKGTTGGSFSVIAELDAGIVSHTQRLIPATSALLYTTKGWINTSKVESLQNGFMMAEAKNQKMVMRFKGENLSMYAAVGEGYGEVDVKLDGKYVQTIDLDSENADARKLMLHFENLDDKVHTLEIITKSSRRVMINMFGINYTESVINAPNIYKEKALTISLVVFVLMFAALLALVICLLFIPKFRKLMGNNKCIAALDKKLEENKAKRKQKREDKKLQKLLSEKIGDNAKNKKDNQTDSKSKLKKDSSNTAVKAENAVINSKPVVSSVKATKADVKNKPITKADAKEKAKPITKTDTKPDSPKVKAIKQEELKNKKSENKANQSKSKTEIAKKQTSKAKSIEKTASKASGKKVKQQRKK